MLAYVPALCCNDVVGCKWGVLPSPFYAAGISLQIAQNKEGRQQW